MRAKACHTQRSCVVSSADCIGLGAGAPWVGGTLNQGFREATQRVAHFAVGKNYIQCHLAHRLEYTHILHV